jgi:hypothetical protein
MQVSKTVSRLDLTDTWIAAMPVSCANGEYCGFQTALDVLGCCASFHTTTSSSVVLDSCNYHIACIDAYDFDEGACDDNCASNDMILKW